MINCYILGVVLFINNLFALDDGIKLPQPYLSFEHKTNCPKGYPSLTREYIDIESPMKEVLEDNWQNLLNIDDDLDRESLLKAIKTNVEYWREKPDNFTIKVSSRIFKKQDMLNMSLRLYDIFSSSMTYPEILNAIKKEFKIYKAISDDTKDVTITGYYESEIYVRKEKDSEYKYPLHFRPPDLVKVNGGDFDYGRYDENGNLVRYYSTQEIRNGAIDHYALEIAFSNHPSHIMLAQIQGSSIIRYPDGSYERITFDGANGWKFVSVQRILMDCGEIPSMNFKDFINYLSSQPQEREERLVNLNPRYIFFKKAPSNSNPSGAISKELIPQRSVAIDPAYIPYGILAYIVSRKPVSDENGERIIEFRKFSRFIATHDTGSAIRGAGRIDIFWGNGKKAELEASSMKEKALFYLILPGKI